MVNLCEFDLYCVNKYKHELKDLDDEEKKLLKRLNFVREEKTKTKKWINEIMRGN